MARKHRISNRASSTSPESVYYHIQIGRTSTDDFRYVGVQPPLNKSDTYEFKEALDEAISDFDTVLSGLYRLSDQGNPYTEFNIMGYPSDETLAAAAHIAIGTILRPGDSVQIDPVLHPMPAGIGLFRGRTTKHG